MKGENNETCETRQRKNKKRVAHEAQRVPVDDLMTYNRRTRALEDDEHSDGSTIMLLAFTASEKRRMSFMEFKAC